MGNRETRTPAIVQPDVSRIAVWLMVLVVIFAVAAVVLALLDPPETDSVADELLDTLHRHFDPGLEANLAT